GEIDEIGSQILGIGPIDRIGEDERNAVLPQQADKSRFEEALMANLDRVPQISPALGPGPSAAPEAMIVPFGEGRCSYGISRKQRKEIRKALSVKSEPRRELPQEWTQLFFEAQDAGSKEIGERRLDVAKLLQMGDEPAALDGEDEALRCLVVPTRKGIGMLQRVMGAIDLDRVD